MRSLPSFLRALPLLSAAILLAACNGNVVLETGAGAGEGGGGAGGSAGVGTGTGPGTGTGTGTSTGTGAGGASDDEAAAIVAKVCPAIAAEPHYCISLAYPGTILALGPDTGNTCKLGDIAGASGPDVSSIGVVGSLLHGCGNDSGAWRVPITGGALDVAGTPCQALTDYQGGLLVYSFDSTNGIQHYATFEDIAAGKPVATYSIDGTFSRISTRGNTLFSAWHSTNTVLVNELPSGAKSPDLLLESFDDWVNGMSVTGDGRLYIATSGNVVMAFDAASGKVLQKVPLQIGPGELVSTLHCWSH